MQRLSRELITVTIAIILVIILIIALVMTIAYLPGPIEDYGVKIKVDRPANAYRIEAGVEETIGEIKR